MSNPFHRLFRRWFSAPPQTAVVATPAAPAPADAPSTPAAAISLAAPPVMQAANMLPLWKPVLPIDTLYFDWLMGYPGESSPANVEQDVLQALYGLLTSDLNDAVVVPRMPAVIPPLLASLRNPDISVGELTRLIVKDVVLVGEVVNAVNSALYNPLDKIDSLDNAVQMLGEDGLRYVIAKVAFRPIINVSTGPFTRRAAPTIWMQTEKCALACHTLAPVHADCPPFHAFLAGLMKNTGLIIAFRVLDQECATTRFRYSPTFQMALNAVAATLSYRIAQRWEFPPAVITALQQQAGGRKAIDWTPLGQVLHTADLISKMRVLVNQAQLSRNDAQLKTGLNAAAAACFDRLNELQLFELQRLDAASRK